MEPFNNEALSIDVGVRLRDLREERNLSMRALARMSGLSANALSMIERSKSSPSVSTLYKLSEAMEVPITAFFRTETDQKEVVFLKGNERTRVPFHRGLWEGLGGEYFSGRVEPFMLTLESGANSGRFSMAHSGHEFVLCLRGQLEYRVENQHFILEPGDSLLFAAELKHQWRNPGSTVTNAVFVLAGFEEGESPSEFHIASGLADDEVDEDSIVEDV
ncbi:MAG: helix-turn-helix domain-containing protein [Chloroflexi bacterium]|nr:helix-turn-helix domain-containing protein [Chloroflexota bacterium]MBL7162913.1 helix-turn-helix domain-containing protein [Anaerolineales bacterium]